MPRMRRWTDAAFTRAVAENASIAGVLRALGLIPSGANYQTVHHTVKRLGLDTTHWTGQGHLKGKTHNWTKKKPLEAYLVANDATPKGPWFKRRLIREGYLKNVCSCCGQLPVWHGEPLVLVLDHINGHRADNRLRNLRLLCPNCNSQQSTFAGRNRGRVA